MSEIIRAVDIDAPIELAFDTICDFTSYPSFLEGMKNVKIVKTFDQHAQVSFTLDLFKRIIYTIDIVMQRPTDVSWNLVASDMMKRNDGSWKLSKLGPRKTTIQYAIDVEFKIWVPQPISTFLVNTSIPSTLESFKKEIERRA